ncbi:transposase [Chryseobacterium gambrini]|uniref:transposase n=1 Tax=Chryseobacterium gambrini TaxID=373672 RepID=UPI003D0B67DD
MKFNFKEIHIGELIKTKVDESKTVDIQRICNFFKCNEECIYEMYKHESIDTKLLLKWSKLLEYDFFRVYTQHQILYSPPAAASYIENVNNKKQSGLPQFRKNIYTKEVIEFIWK